MNSAELLAAAREIEAAANRRAVASQQTRDPTYFRLFSETAQQLRDRADQVRSWARELEYRERRCEAVDASRLTRIEAGTTEFLRMARVGR